MKFIVTFILRLLWNKQDVALIAKAGFRLLGGLRTFHSKRAQCLCFIDVNLFETGFFSIDSDCKRFCERLRRL